MMKHLGNTEPKLVYSQVGHLLSKFFYWFAGTPTIGVQLSYSGVKGFFKSSPSLIESGKWLGLGNEENLIFLKIQQNRLLKYKVFISIVYFIVAVSLSAILYVLFFDSKTSQIKTPLYGPFWDRLFLTLFIFILSLAIRIASILVDRQFADTLCVLSGMCLLVELNHDDALIKPEKRSAILFRLRILIRNIILLSLQNASHNPETDLWIRNYFFQMERFVRERERIIIAPTKGSASKLRRDFQKFIIILLAGNYGEFKSVKGKLISTTSTKDPANRVLNGFLRLIGTLAPFILLLLIFQYPENIKSLGLDNNTIALVLIAWLLLAIDSNLKLGIVERITGLAKTMNELR